MYWCKIFLRSQFATSNIESENVSSKGGRRYLPYVFTAQGIAMLSAILRSDETSNRQLLMSRRKSRAFLKSVIQKMNLERKPITRNTHRKDRSGVLT